MSQRFCSVCGVNVRANVQYCTSCGAFVGEERVFEMSGDWALLRTTDGKPVPLLGVALGGEVFGAHARLVLRQRYKNREEKPIEAVYTFPIPGDATLTGFAMECEGRRIEAEVKEREEAFQVYDEAISKGHGAALLEQERPNVFTASVGNLLPDEETIVEVTFLQKLTADEGALRLMIPTLVAPRYIPGTPAGDRTGHGAAAPTNVVPDADRITPKIADVNYGISMDVVFDLGRDVTIESPSHAIEAHDEGGSRKRVTFAAPLVALDRDIVLVAEGAPGVTAGVVCDKAAGEEGTFALTIVPDLFEAKKRSKGRAVVFVVDVSGSMDGPSIDQAKQALRLCLRHLHEGDLFDILPFSTGFSRFSSRIAGGGGQMVPFTQTTLREADQFVERLMANGGTEMLEPLTAAARLLSGVKRDRVIVLLTDGEVGNEAQILAEVSKKTDGARVYTFGIGTNVSDELLRELARRTKGAVEFIHPGERIDEKVTAQFARATAARVEGLQVKWVGADAGEVAPAEPPALVDGEPWSVYGRYEAPGIGRVELRGTLGGEPFFAEIPLELAARAERPALASLWAGARVRDLEGVDASSLGRRAEAHKRRIVDLCVRFGIASKHASFVVVEKRTGDRRGQGMPETRAVPVNAPAGWQMFQQPREENVRTRAGSLSRGMAVPSRAYAAAPAAARRSAPMAAPGGPPPAFGAPPPPAPAAYAPEGFGAPPPPACAPPPPAMAAPMARPAAAAPARAQTASGGGGLFERAKKALGLGRDSGPREELDDAPAMFDRMESDEGFAAPEPEPAAAEAAGEDIGAMFARQLASGLWEGGSGSDEDRLAATATCLSRCAREGIDTSHAVYGAQVTKAVDAALAAAETLAKKGAADEVVIVALLAMVAVSTGKRTRSRAAAVAQAAASAAVRAALPDLASQDAAKRRLA